MDMPLPVHPSQIRAAARLADAVASWDECVSLMGETGVRMTAVLDQVERELSGRGVRCVRVCGPASGGLALRDLLAQIVGRAGPDALTDDDLGAGFVTLSEPGEGYDRVALLVTEAHGLLTPALRYIQLSCQSSPALRVVLAGQHSLAGVLAQQEFAYLRQRITRNMEMPNPRADDPTVFALAAPSLAALEPPPMPAVRRWGGPWTLARLGLAASLALVIWTTRWADLPTPPAAATRADAPDRAERGTLAAEAPPAQPDAPLVVWTTRWVDEPVPPGAAASADVPTPDGYAALALAEPGLPAMDAPREPEAAEPIATMADQPLAEATPPVAAAVPSQAAPVAAGQERLEATRERAEEIPPTPEQVATAAATPLPLAALDAPVPEMPTRPAEPVDGDASAYAEATQERAEAPAHGVGQAAIAAPEPAVAAELPIPPPFRLPMVAALPPEVPRAGRPTRAAAARVAAPLATPPARVADERRCREIVLKAQLGEDPSDADIRFLRGRCRSR